MVALPIFIALGNWQLNRAEEKRQLLALYETNSVLAAKRVDSQFRFTESANLMYRKIQVTGRYVGKYLLALDNQVEQGKVGFHIYTPFMIENSDQLILVNRGWVAMVSYKRELPVVDTTDKLITLTGLMYMPSEPGFKLGDTSIKTRARDIVQYIDLKKLGQDLGLKLLPIVMLLDKNMASGFKCNWKILAASPEKSTSYAMQWYTFAVLLAGLYIGLNLKRTK